jgi:hypothetical protein
MKNSFRSKRRGEPEMPLRMEQRKRKEGQSMKTKEESKKVGTAGGSGQYSFATSQVEVLGNSANCEEFCLCL